MKVVGEGFVGETGGGEEGDGDLGSSKGRREGVVKVKTMEEGERTSCRSRKRVQEKRTSGGEEKSAQWTVVGSDLI